MNERDEGPRTAEIQKEGEVSSGCRELDWDMITHGVADSIHTGVRADGR